jgi:hypothetical protein
MRQGRIRSCRSVISSSVYIGLYSPCNSNYLAVSIPTPSLHLSRIKSSTQTTMLFSATAALLLSSVCSATVLPREDSNSKSTESQKFITHSKPKGAEGFENSLGYLFDEYTYGAGYAVSLHTEKSDAVAGAIFNTALDFGNGDPKGFKMHDLSNKFPNSLPEIYSGQDGTPGIAVENGLLKWNSPDGVPISWFGRLPKPRIV